MQSVLLDAAGWRRSPATLLGYARGRPPRNKGLQYPADPPSVEEIIRVDLLLFPGVMRVVVGRGRRG